MFASVLIANVANSLVSDFLRVIPFTTSSISISVFLVFTAIMLAFNQYIWHWPGISKLAGVPNISGKWVGPLDSSYTDENGGDPMRPTFTIHQTWTRIEVNGDFARSRSEEHEC